MALLAKQIAKIGGTAVAFAAAAAGGDQVKADTRSVLLVKNGAGALITVTVVIPGNTEFGQPQPDVAVDVAAGATAAIGPFPREAGDDSGQVTVTYSDATSVTVAVVGF